MPAGLLQYNRGDSFRFSKSTLLPSPTPSLWRLHPPSQHFTPPPPPPTPPPTPHTPHATPHTPHPTSPQPKFPTASVPHFSVSQFPPSVFFVQSIFSFRATAICPLERKSWIEKGETFDFTLLPCVFLQLMRRLLSRLHDDREHDTGALDGWGCDIIQPLPLCLTFLFFLFLFRNETAIE